MKVVINRCFGGFGLSKKACEYLGIDWKVTHGYNYISHSSRTAPELVQCVETLGKAASGEFADLKVVEIPDDVDWYIVEDDGLEMVAEAHRSWY